MHQIQKKELQFGIAKFYNSAVPKFFLRALSFMAVLFLTAQSAFAAFGEIDLLTRESVEQFFKDQRKQIRPETFNYRGQVEYDNETAKITVHSEIYAEQFQIRPFWALYDCTTTLQQEGSSFVDLGTECDWSL